MAKPDTTLAQIAAQFTHHDVEKSGSGYLILDRHSQRPLARLRPIRDTDRFECSIGLAQPVAGKPSAIWGA
jgi:hypothetical protein